MSPHEVHLDPATLRVPEGHSLRRLPKAGLLVAAIGAIAAIALMVMGGDEARRQFFFSYLVAYAFFCSLALGGLFFVLVNLATRAGWSVTLRRAAENAAGTLPVLAVLFVPLMFGLHDLYHWADAEHASHDPILSLKLGYLNAPFFIGRAVFVVVAWALLGWWFRRESVVQDDSGERDVRLGWTMTTSSRRVQKLAAPALAVFALTSTVAAFDWMMSLEPHWYSTIYGGYYFAGSVIAILALLIIVHSMLQGMGFLGRAVTDEHYHDLGKYLFAFVVFWGYIAFSQFMLIWYANIPEETAWYHQRAAGSWDMVSKILLWGHFLVPFFFLIRRAVKRSRPLLFLGASYLLVIHFVDIHWLVMPTLHAGGPQPGLLDVAGVLIVGGAFVYSFTKNMTSSALVPLKDPRLHEALAFENF